MPFAFVEIVVAVTGVFVGAVISAKGARDAAWIVRVHQGVYASSVTAIILSLQDLTDAQAPVLWIYEWLGEPFPVLLYKMVILLCFIGLGHTIYLAELLSTVQRVASRWALSILFMMTQFGFLILAVAAKVKVP